MLKTGTLVEFSSCGAHYVGFVVGTCSYDNFGEPNAYVIRYVFTADDETPRKPYTVVDADKVELVKKYPDDFFVAGHWSATPKDRCDDWVLKKEDGFLVIVGEKKAKEQ